MPSPTKPTGKIVAAIGATKQSARCQIDAVGPTDCAAVPAPGEVLTWDGANWVPGAGAGGAGINELDQDVIAGPGIGKQSATVVALQNYSLSASAPANGEALVWNGVASEWQPTALPVPVTDVTASSPLSSSGGTTPNISLDSGGPAGEVLTWNGAAWVSAAPVDTGITQLTGDVLAGPGSGSQVASIAAGVVDTTELSAGVNAVLPTSGEKAALAGTFGPPGLGNEYVTTTDPRNSDSRTPTGLAGGDLGGSYPNPSVVALQGNPVSASAPSVGDVLVWDGTAWVPTPMTTVFPAANLDAFGRLRVSAPQTIFDSKLVNDTQILYWDGAQIGGAPAPVWTQSTASIALAVNAVGQSSVRQSKRYFNYQPGKSQLIYQTFNAKGAVAGVVKKIGYFDANNGLYLLLDGTGPSFVRLSGSAPAPTETVPQLSWNIDPLDGSGPSGFNLDFNKTQILTIDFEWLGVGSVRMGFVIEGQIIYAHRFDNANVQTAVYMSTPNLPIRYEIESTGGSSSIDCICSTVISEGGLDRTGTGFSYVTPSITPNIASGITAPLVALKLNALYPRVTVIPTIVNPLSVSSGISTWEFVLNPAIAGMIAGASNIGYCDTLVYSAGATATGGTVVASGVFSNQSGLTSLNIGDITTTLPLVSDYAGVSDVFCLRVKNLTGGTERYIASLDWVALT